MNEKSKMSTVIRTPSCFVCFALTLSFLSGCGPAERKYTPTVDSAREALDTALEKWKSGSAHARVEDFRVPIDVFDSRWQKGKKLESYEILEEEKSNGPSRIFAVRMKLDEDKEEQEVKYYIVGIDPLLIFREQDYNRASGM